MKKLVLTLILILTVTSGCTAPKAQDYTGFYLDTIVTLSCYSKDAQELFAACTQRLQSIHNTFNAYDSLSELSVLNQSGGTWVQLSDDMFALLSIAYDCAAATNGAFDPTVYPAVLAWDSMSGEVIPNQDTLDSIKPLVDYTGLELNETTKSARLKPGQKVDLGGIAKGYAANELKKIYDQYGASGIINLGGNVYTVGIKPNKKPFKVAIRDPKDSEKWSLVLELSDVCAVTSGDYQRFFEKDGLIYHHILDPVTLKPTNSGLSSATLIMEDCAKADAYATALMVMGTKKAEEFCHQNGLRAVLITSTGEVIEINNEAS